ncbi:MAG: hypothetical protein GY842_18250 [bacterium]|nr:hypothetical protein [bacterium]
MHAHRFKVTVPKEHRLSLDLPEQFPPRPAEVIVLAPPRESRRIVRAGGALSPEGPLPDGDPIREALNELREERSERLDCLVAELEAGADS